MSGFTPLPIVPGDVPGEYHMNRFRICVQALPTDKARFAAIGHSILQNMPHYMDPHTAKVGLYAPWQGHPTLRFIGKARFRPFSIPVYNPLTQQWVDVPVPEDVRDLMIPDVHPDLVGVVALMPTSVTVQTLKRNYVESFEILSRLAAERFVAGLQRMNWRNPLLSLIEDKLVDMIMNEIVYINQHHFLAGRRSFRFAAGISFGYNDSRYVFETAAMERFSLPVYEKSTLMMGSAEGMVRPVWIEMVKRFCDHNGLRVIPDIKHGGHWQAGPNQISYLQQSFFSYNAMIGSREGQDMAGRHAAIHP